MKFRHYHRIRQHAAPHAGAASYMPGAVAKAYQFPQGLTGVGKTVGVIELGGQWSAIDLAAFCQKAGIQSPQVTAVMVNGAAPVSDPGGANVEVMLDIEIIAAVAPDAKIRVYFADNTEAGFAAAIQQAVADRCDAISISWGAPEDQWSGPGMNAVDAAMRGGPPCFVAAGDSGSSDGETGSHVDYPASNPYAVGCGGTSLKTSVLDGAWVSESVWNDGTQGGATGGGISSIFGLPTYQDKAGVPSGNSRAVPDVAAHADENIGYEIYADGQWQVVGGTSAAAPLWAALSVLLKQATGKPLTQAFLYANAAAFQDITSGNNGTYTAKTGYDCCTGLGSPNGMKLLAALQGVSPTPPPPAPSPAPSPPPPPVSPPPSPSPSPAPTPPPVSPPPAPTPTPVLPPVQAVEAYFQALIDAEFAKLEALATEDWQKLALEAFQSEVDGLLPLLFAQLSGVLAAGGVAVKSALFAHLKAVATKNPFWALALKTLGV